jgi:hypothetical protein
MNGEIRLTPDYAALFRAHLTDAAQHADAAAHQPTCTPLQSFASCIVSLSIAAQCITTSGHVEQLRSELALMASDLTTALTRGSEPAAAKTSQKEEL